MAYHSLIYSLVPHTTHPRSAGSGITQRTQVLTTEENTRIGLTLVVSTSGHDALAVVPFLTVGDTDGSEAEAGERIDASGVGHIEIDTVDGLVQLVTIAESRRIRGDSEMTS